MTVFFLSLAKLYSALFISVNQQPIFDHPMSSIFLLIEWKPCTSLLTTRMHAARGSVYSIVIDYGSHDSLHPFIVLYWLYYLQHYSRLSIT